MSEIQVNDIMGIVSKLESLAILTRHKRKVGWVRQAKSLR